MSNFKIGEKVVFKPIKDEKFDDWRHICPIKENEIVTIKSYCNVYNNSIDILEYPNTLLGNLLSIHVRHFRKLDHQFAEDVCAKLIEEFNSEPIFN